MNRFHDLDALRAIMMLLGIFQHATIFLIGIPELDFWPARDPWADLDHGQTNPYGWLLLTLRGFRMPLFFILSGFFTAMLWQRRGLRELGIHRAERIGLPLLVGMFTIIPLTHWTFTLGAGQPFFWPVHFYHFWFLWFLLLLIGGFIIAARLGLQFRHPIYAFMPLLTLLPLFLMRQTVGADVPTQALPPPELLGYYLLFFVFGAFLYQRAIAVRRWWTWALLPAPVALFAAAFLVHAPGQPDTTARWLAAALAQGGYVWLMAFGGMGLFRWLAARERPWVRYISDSAYWLYVAHLPLVIAAQWALVEYAPFLNPHLKFLLICLGVPALLLLIYDRVIRYTIVGTMLNGPRHRVPPPAATTTSGPAAA